MKRIPAVTGIGLCLLALPRRVSSRRSKKVVGSDRPLFWHGELSRAQARSGPTGLTLGSRVWLALLFASGHRGGTLPSWTPPHLMATQYLRDSSKPLALWQHHPCTIRVKHSSAGNKLDRGLIPGLPETAWDGAMNVPVPARRIHLDVHGRSPNLSTQLFSRHVLHMSAVLTEATISDRNAIEIVQRRPCILELAICQGHRWRAELVLLAAFYRVVCLRNAHSFARR